MTDERVPAEDVERTMAGLDASRRVGWAKYFNEANLKDHERAMNLHRLGVVSEIILSAPKNTRRGVINQMVTATVDEFLVEKEDHANWEAGRNAARAIASSTSGSWQQAFKDVFTAVAVGDPKIRERGANDVRCSYCDRMLALQVEGGGTTLEIKCTRCSRVGRYST